MHQHIVDKRYSYMRQAAPRELEIEHALEVRAGIFQTEWKALPVVQLVAPVEAGLELITL